MNFDYHMTEQKNRIPELLAPAGNKESLIGAFNAGADAVYLAGERFGARAYASNFSMEDLIGAIHYAHLFNRKIYLTVNTLIKNTELGEMADFLRPYYEAGLDGIIVQDLGVFYLVREFFPGLEIHISTQMTITGSYGATLMKQLGACRVVPARELTLEEIRSIKKRCDIEIETFIHGAMCYSYSGACLFSSMLGGRSGNRGRCAQPCRLSYQVISPDLKRVGNVHDTYCISMKDMCTIDMIPQMVDSGIDSFKIEGRMKKSEYAAGVSSIYRKYLDVCKDENSSFQVTKQDREFLEKLYTRSLQHTGYYDQHNGRDMITLEKPSYNGTDDQLLEMIREKYLSSTLKRTAQFFVKITPGEALAYTLTCNDMTVTGNGEIVQKAQNRPLEQDEVKKQLNKTGNTNIVFDQIELELSPDSFISLKALNEIRRNAILSLEEALLSDYKRNLPDADMIINFDQAEKKQADKEDSMKSASAYQTKTAVSVSTSEQIRRVIKFKYVKKIYIPADLILNHENQRTMYYNPIWDTLIEWDGEVHIILPQIIRDIPFGLEGQDYYDKMLSLLKQDRVNGFLVKSMDALGYLISNHMADHMNEKEITADAGIYQFNAFSNRLLDPYVDHFTIPYELNLPELLQVGIHNMEIPVYGRIPMMISANCVRKTSSGCDMGNRTEYYDFAVKENALYLRDRYQTDFPVVCDCTHCHNTIYNSVPLSLHQYIERFSKEQPYAYRIDLTIESGAETESVMMYFSSLKEGEKPSGEPPYKNYTKGHLARGVE